MSPREARYALAAELQAVAPDGYTVYAYPVDESQLMAPAIVLAPRAPYRSRGDLAICDWQVNLSLIMVMQLNASVPGIDALDDLLDTLMPALDASVTQAVMSEVNSLGQVTQLSGIEYMTSTAQVTLHI